MATIDDALNGMSARDLEAMREKIERRLRACVICQSDGAVPVRGVTKLGTNAVSFALLLCPACIQRHRLPESRADGAAS